RTGEEQVGGDILEPVQRRHPVPDNGGPMVEVLEVWPLEGELIEAFTKHAAGADQRRILQVHIYARNRGKFAAQLLDDFIDMRAAGARLEMHENAAAVAADGGAPGA